MDERRKSVLDDRVSSCLHQRKEVMNIVYCQTGDRQYEAGDLELDNLTGVLQRSLLLPGGV